jgi:3-dehydroquinate dehydratase-2
MLDRPPPMNNLIYVVNGPNLNMLGVREPEVYGTETLDGLRSRTEKAASSHGLKIDFRQSNVEGEIVNWVQEARDKAAGIIINAGGYTHTSVAILDALQAAELPVIEVHLSNIFRRDRFRQHSYISLGATGVICGLGGKGYELAIEAMADILRKAGGKA